MLIVKIILILTLGFIFYEDVKERQVYWILFPLIAVGCGVLHYFETLPELFFGAVAINLIFVSVLILLVFLYTRYKLKASFNQAFGLGDLLIFLALSFSFSTVTFIILFNCGFLFSVVLHLTIKKNFITVPLAGYMSLFFGLTYLAYWSGFINSVYTI